MTSSRHLWMRRTGFSLAESLISIVIVGSLTVAALNTVSATTIGRSQVSRKAIAHGIGQALLSEIMALPYEDPDQTPTFGLEPSESSTNRLDFDDVDDYRNWNRATLEKKNGDPLLVMADWSRYVEVDWVKQDDLTTTSATATDVKRITVNVNYKTSEFASFVGIRTPGPPDAPSPKILYLIKGLTIITATTTELARIALLESWGYEVVTIDDSSLQSYFDQQSADVAAIYVSSEVDPSMMFADISTTTIGIINEHPSLHAGLGFGDRVDLTDQPDIRLDVVSHYITSEFTPGWRTIFTTSQPVATLTTNVAAGVNPLGYTLVTGVTTHLSLAYFNAGDILWDGSPAPGRRVMLPWGQPAFDFNALNANGQTIMQRSVAWAAGLDTP